MPWGRRRNRWQPPRGRHSLPREVVAEAQRERLLEATLPVVAERGYRATTIGDLVAAAEISRTTFYALFEDRESCFLAAYDDALGELLDRVAAAYEPEERWPDRVRTGLQALLEALAEEPELARLVLVDAAGAGPAAQRRRRAALQRLALLFDEGRDFAPEGRELPADISRMAVGAALGLICDALLEGRGAELPSLLSDVFFATLVLYIGPHAAAREAGDLVR